jgi:hypothetical protein
MRAITSRVFSPLEADRIFLSIRRRELEHAGKLAKDADRLVAEVVLQLLLDRQVRIERVGRVRREIARLPADSELRRALPRLTLHTGHQTSIARSERPSHQGSASRDTSLPKTDPAHGVIEFVRFSDHAGCVHGNAESAIGLEAVRWNGRRR